MRKGFVQVYCGEGKGKSTAAMGNALRAASEGKTAVIIQFLKRKNEKEIEFIKRLEPEIKLFRFEKFCSFYDDLSKDEQKEEAMNIKNGLNFAKKVLATEGCDILILDEILGLIDKQIITVEELQGILSEKSEETEIILTGRILTAELQEHVDEVYQIKPIK